jgi:hypothetical protein
VKGIAQRAELAGSDPPRGRTPRQPLQIADAVQCLTEPSSASTVVHLYLDRIEPGVDAGRIAEGREQPLPQQPAAHRCERGIQNLQQGRALGSGPKWLDQLEISPGHLIDPEECVAPSNHRTRQVRQPTRLQLAQVAKQRTSGSNGGCVIHSETQTIQ